MHESYETKLAPTPGAPPMTLDPDMLTLADLGIAAPLVGAL
jgi:hypothetical protein